MGGRTRKKFSWKVFSPWLNRLRDPERTEGNCLEEKGQVRSRVRNTSREQKTACRTREGCDILGDWTIQSHWDGHPSSTDSGTIKRKNKCGDVTTAAKKCMCSQAHTVFSLNGIARLRNVRAFDKFWNFITTQKAMYVFMLDISFLVSRESFLDFRFRFLI